jgi:tRNA(Ile)-lysidine synthase
MDWQGESEVALPAAYGVLHFERVSGRGLSLQKLQQGKVVIRSRQGGEYIQLDAKRPRQSLRNLLPQLEIPPWQREYLPLVYCGKELVCVAGVATAAAFMAESDEDGVLVYC